MAKIKIAVLGLGAVGGYFGGLLADHYIDSDEIEIILIAREKTVNIIKEKGLKIISSDGEKVIFPKIITNDPVIIGTVDYLILAVKSYDLEESLTSFKDCISAETIILPLLNGIDAKDRITAIFPKAKVWDGCVYIVSRLMEPGVIKETGNDHSLYFGSRSSSPEKLKKLETILKAANINCFLSSTIEQTIWEKFLFISATASLTSYLDLPIGGILNNNENRNTLINLLEELKLIADTKNIPLSDNIIEKIISRMEKLPYETTSSMHSDFKKGGRTEFRSLTEYVSQLGDSLKIETPTYDKIAGGLRSKTN